MKPVKAKRIAAGFYEGVYLGVKFQVSKIYHEYDKEWYWDYTIGFSGKCNEFSGTKKGAVLNAMSDIELNYLPKACAGYFETH